MTMRIRRAQATERAGAALLAALAILPVGAGAQQAGAPGSSRETSLQAAPAFTPMTVRPQILNETEIVRELQRAYPPLLREAGIGGTVKVFFFIDADGRVANAVLAETSGYGPLDEAALRVARTYRFDPARNRDERVPVWVQFPVTFRAGAAAPTSSAPPAELAERPAFTPFTVRPRILNEAEIVREMQRAYPALLRDAGISGTVIVAFFVDAEGRVGNVLVHESSGHAELDAAALRVASTYRFAPAMNRDRAVPVWVQFPVTFRVPPE